jgi:hypothetical protein
MSTACFPILKKATIVFLSLLPLGCTDKTSLGQDHPKPCTYGADLTCNGDQSVSVPLGTCQTDGTCVCKAGALLNSTTGRCEATSSSGAGGSSVGAGGTTSSGAGGSSVGTGGAMSSGAGGTALGTGGSASGGAGASGNGTGGSAGSLAGGTTGSGSGGTSTGGAGDASIGGVGGVVMGGSGGISAGGTGGAVTGGAGGLATGGASGIDGGVPSSNVCPSIRPGEVYACTRTGSSPCWYLDCSGTGKLYWASCVGGSWSLGSIACVSQPCGQTTCPMGQICLEHHGTSTIDPTCVTPTCGTAAITTDCVPGASTGCNLDNFEMICMN